MCAMPEARMAPSSAVKSPESAQRPPKVWDRWISLGRSSPPAPASGSACTTSRARCSQRLSSRASPSALSRFASVTSVGSMRSNSSASRSFRARASSSTFAFDRSPASAAADCLGHVGEVPRLPDASTRRRSALIALLGQPGSGRHRALCRAQEPAVALPDHRRGTQCEQRLDPLELRPACRSARRPTPPAGRRALPRSLGSGSLTAMRRRYQPTCLNTTYLLEFSLCNSDARTSAGPEDRSTIARSDTYRHHKE